jgi:hypothetical protein
LWPNEGTSRHLPGRTEDTHENSIADVPDGIETEYKYGVLLLRCVPVEGVV